MPFLRKSSLPAHLRKSEFIEVLPKTELRQLDQIATVLDVVEGRRIITEATTGRECFVVVDGEFMVDGPDVATTIGVGDVAGELALLTGRQRNASVVATSDSTVYVMHQREFATLLGEAPHFSSRVVKAASDRLGAEPVSLPAQFVSKGQHPIATRPSWSQTLHDVPAWKPVY